MTLPALARRARRRPRRDECAAAPRSSRRSGGSSSSASAKSGASGAYCSAIVTISDGGNGPSPHASGDPRADRDRRGDELGVPPAHLEPIQPVGDLGCRHATGEHRQAEPPVGNVDLELRVRARSRGRRAERPRRRRPDADEWRSRRRARRGEAANGRPHLPPAAPSARRAIAPRTGRPPVPSPRSERASRAVCSSMRKP